MAGGNLLRGSQGERALAAPEAARSSDVAIVVVGTNSDVESEGYDRKSLVLPGLQDNLVRAVAAANPRAIVIINAGAPVLMPWRDEVAAILLTYFPGQELDNALADIVFGATEPGGRLPTTWPKTEEDLPVLNVTPDNGNLRYDEGIHIGYRAWLKHGTQPAYAFGHGLGYTDWALKEASLTPADPNNHDDLSAGSLSVTLQNTGSRPGKQVIQAYAERTDSKVDRPARWLVAFTKVEATAGKILTTEIPLRPRDFAYWSDESGWTQENGTYRLGLHLGGVVFDH